MIPTRYQVPTTVSVRIIVRARTILTAQNAHHLYRYVRRHNDIQVPVYITHTMIGYGEILVVLVPIQVMILGHFSSIDYRYMLYN